MTKPEFAVLLAKITFEALDAVMRGGASAEQGLKKVADAALAGAADAAAVDAGVDARIDAEKRAKFEDEGGK